MRICISKRLTPVLYISMWKSMPFLQSLTYFGIPCSHKAILSNQDCITIPIQIEQFLFTLSITVVVGVLITAFVHLVSKYCKQFYKFTTRPFLLPTSLQHLHALPKFCQQTSLVLSVKLKPVVASVLSRNLFSFFLQLE